jgi:hypothetical protein
VTAQAESLPEDANTAFGTTDPPLPSTTLGRDLDDIRLQVAFQFDMFDFNSRIECIRCTCFPLAVAAAGVIGTLATEEDKDEFLVAYWQT